MTILALVEKTEGKRFRAMMTQPVALQADGDSREEAIEHLRLLAEERIARGELVKIDFPDAAPQNPWLKIAGIWKDHPEFADYRDDVAEYRRQANAVDVAP